MGTKMVTWQGWNHSMQRQWGH